MVRSLTAALLLLGACSSSTTTTTSPGICPTLSGSWTVKTHCDSSLVGKTVVVTQTDCTLSFGPPFNGFTATVTPDSKVSVSGPQTCSGTTSASSIAMSCTPGTCNVTLTR